MTTKKIKFIILIPSLLILSLVISNKHQRHNGAPPYMIEDSDPPDNSLAILTNWIRPDGPVKVALQAGHWKNNELPTELERLRDNSGSSGGGKWEWEVNLTIAQETKTLLEQKGVTVDILPATVPENYWADVFVAIHADGSTNSSASGFKVTHPRRDFSGTAQKLSGYIESEYQKATQLEIDSNITRAMRGYYAFAWWRFNHAVHPKTASVILETGFLTNPDDRKIIVNNPEVSAEGLANGIIEYLISQNLIK